MRSGDAADREGSRAEQKSCKHKDQDKGGDGGTGLVGGSRRDGARLRGFREGMRCAVHTVSLLHVGRGRHLHERLQVSREQRLLN